MLTLAIQTATDPAQIALLDASEVIAEYTIHDRYSVCRELAPEILRILTQTGHVAADVDLVAVCAGPGSFTGIRIGIAAAKAYAHALDTPLVSVDSLRALAHGVSARYVISCIGAGRESAFCGAYNEKGESLRKPVMLPCAQMNAWISEISATANGNDYMMVRHSCPKVTELAGELKMQTIERSVTAATIGAIGIVDFENGNMKDSLSLAPFYLRLSSPEERIAQLKG
jgi:tRNA threonylcarbamoyladenosine biosynthesis protein TsaB